jgi:hypothetical protein
VRELLRGQDRTEWVIVSTGMFTSFFFEPGLGVVDLNANIVHALGRWDVAVTVSRPKLCSPHHGSPRCSIERRHERWSVPELKAELALDPDNPIRKYCVVFAEGRGAVWDKSRSLNTERGIGVTSVQGWIRQPLPAPPAGAFATRRDVPGCRSRLRAREQAVFFAVRHIAARRRHDAAT